MNNLDKWIDPRVKLVKAAGLHAYLLARGWKEKPYPRPQVRMFEEPPGHPGKPILQTVPAFEQGSDYIDSVVRVITNLAVIEDRHAVDVLNDVLQASEEDAPSANGAPAAAPRRKGKKP